MGFRDGGHYVGVWVESLAADHYAKQTPGQTHNNEMHHQSPNMT